tara:strand:- start:361 stop:591 length:231 start_codon:yes stop_codon:yes gene_type:complete
MVYLFGRLSQSLLLHVRSFFTKLRKHLKSMKEILLKKLTIYQRKKENLLLRIQKLLLRFYRPIAKQSKAFNASKKS